MEPSGGSPLSDVASDDGSAQPTPHVGAEDPVAAPQATDEALEPKKRKGKLVGSALLVVAAGALLAVLSKLVGREPKVVPPPAPPLPENFLIPPSKPVEAFKPPDSQPTSETESIPSARAPRGMSGLLPHLDELKSVLKRREQRLRGNTDSPEEQTQTTDSEAPEESPNRASLLQGDTPAPPPDPQSLGNTY